MRRFLVGSLLVASAALVACSSNEPRKNSGLNEASTADGASGAGGEASVEAGPDAPPEAAPEATPDAPPDAPIDAPQEAGLCTTGYVYDFQTSKCWACPGTEAGSAEGGTASDAGEAGVLEGGAIAAGDPYRTSLACQELESAGTFSYDVANNQLVIDTGYPLQLQQVYYDITYYYSGLEGGYPPPVDYHGFATDIQGSTIYITLPQLPPGVPQEVDLNELVLTDVCGRPTVFFGAPDNCVTPPLMFFPSQGDAGTAWMASCGFCG